MIEWFVLPVSVFFGALAMFFGIGFAPMFLLFFLFVLELPVHAAVGATLVVEVFGFLSGLFGYVRRGAVAYLLANQVLLLTIPAAVVGVIASAYLPMWVSVALFSSLLVVTAALILHPEHELLFRFDDPATGFVTSEYGLARNIEMVGATLSGLFAGMTGTGVGEINNYVFLKKYRMPGDLAAGTTVFVIAVTALFAAGAHGIALALHDFSSLVSAGRVLVFALPGVVLGALVGVRVPQDLSAGVRERFVAALFLAQGVLGGLALVLA